MKLRQGFVTNSSSTSFIISINRDWDERNFMKAIGIEGDSPMKEVFKQLFWAIDDNKRDIRAAMKEEHVEFGSARDFLQDKGFREETISIVEELLIKNRIVYYGRLNSVGSSVSEEYFCMESFVVCEEDIYFNGRIGGW